MWSKWNKEEHECCKKKRKQEWAGEWRNIHEREMKLECGSQLGRDNRTDVWNAWKIIQVSI